MAYSENNKDGKDMSKRSKNDYFDIRHYAMATQYDHLHLPRMMFVEQKNVLHKSVNNEGKNFLNSSPVIFCVQRHASNID